MHCSNVWKFYWKLHIQARREHFAKIFQHCKYCLILSCLPDIITSRTNFCFLKEGATNIYGMIGPVQNAVKVTENYCPVGFYCFRLHNHKGARSAPKFRFTIWKTLWWFYRLKLSIKRVWNLFLSFVALWHQC